MTTITSREGFVDAPGGRVWYRIVGDGPRTPLLLLHGGPGAGHDYLEPLEALADERPVVFYDQLGCGKSDIPGDTSLWEIGRFVQELGSVRKALGLDRIHLLGHSWGGWLAIEYMLSRPEGVAGLVLASTSASAQGFADASRGLVDGLTDNIRLPIEKAEAEQNFETPEFQAATLMFYMQHLCRAPQPWPDCLMRTVANSEASPCYAHMWGPSEFIVAGNLKTWDRSARLGEITVPTLITSGRFDEATPALAAELQRGISGSRTHIFENSAHLSHLEEPDEYATVLRAFLREIEAAQ